MVADQRSLRCGSKYLKFHALTHLVVSFMYDDEFFGNKRISQRKRSKCSKS